MTHQTPGRQEAKRKPKQPKKISPRYLKNAGTAYLQRFPASSGHFRTVMTRKIDRSCRAHPEQDRDECLQWLEEETIPYFQDAGYLNDTLYADGLMDSLIRRGHPKRVIAQRMMMKGVSRDEIERVMATYDDEDADWQALLITARKKRCGVYGTDSSPEKRQKDIGKLARAGFSYQPIERFLNLTHDELY